MTAHRGAAAREESAELAMLRDTANRSAADAARTLAELDRRLTSVARPRQAARRIAASARVTAARAAGGKPGGSGGHRALRPVLAAIPVLAAGALFFAVARRKLRNSKLRNSKLSNSEPGTRVRRAVSRRGR